MKRRITGLATGLAIFATMIIFRAGQPAQNGDLLISPYVRSEDIDLSIEELRRIALSDHTVKDFRATSQSEYIITKGQWFTLGHGGMPLLDRRVPMYVVRLTGKTGVFSGTTGIEADYIEVAVDIKERRVFGGGMGSSLLRAPIDVNIIDTGEDMSPLLYGVIMRGQQNTVPLPEATETF